MRITLLTPEFLGIAFAAVLLPLMGALYERWRQRRSAFVPGKSRGIVLAVVLVAVLATAAAQPVLEIDEQSVNVDCDAHVISMLDATKSMLAQAHPGAATRFERQQDAAKRTRMHFEECDWGLGSFAARGTLRVPYTGGPKRFAVVTDRVITINDPIPFGKFVQECDGCRTTSLSALIDAASTNFFPQRQPDEDRGLPARILVVFTDGESAPFDPREVATALHDSRISVIFVHVWEAGEQVFEGGSPAPDYQSDPLSRLNLEAIADAINEYEDGLSGAVFQEDDIEGIVSALDELIGEVRVHTAMTGEVRRVALGPYLVPIALLLAVFFIRGFFKRTAPPRRRLRSLWKNVLKRLKR